MIRVRTNNRGLEGGRTAIRHVATPRRDTARRANAREIAGYIAELTGELAQLAAGADLELLAYFLDMARVESELAARREGGPIVRLARS